MRRLDKALATIVRKAVVKILNDGERPVVVGADDVADYLGKPLYEQEALEQGVGVVTGLAWTPLGGATLPVEATLVHRTAIGLAADRSARRRHAGICQYRLQLSCARTPTASACRTAISTKPFMHLHVPAGATPKDGPSAGITIACALISPHRSATQSAAWP